ncbi:MAG: DNA-3-methyladenine glycosylase 2 family protein, partial [Phyllobacteriaceae bacterium]|nr:DNA-3-methyladenine glycosylase 2 family protein [Phyllobacteriaceae bacterium]
QRRCPGPHGAGGAVVRRGSVGCGAFADGDVRGGGCDAVDDASAGPEAWRQAGLSRPKQKTIAAAAQAVLAGELDLDALALGDAESAIAAMTRIWGIGPWTAEVYLLFAGGHADVFPARDLALQIAVGEHLGLAARPDERQVALLAEDWKPLRSIAARLMWAVYGLDRGLAPPLPA